MGRWKPYVDAQQAIHHLELLRKHGYGIDRIAAISGVSRSTVRRLLRTRDSETSRPRRIRSEIARRLLAVERGDIHVAARILVDASPTRQCIAELRAADHDITDLARRLERTPTSLTRTLQRNAVTLRTDRAVAHLHHQLVQPAPTDPPDGGTAR